MTGGAATYSDELVRAGELQARGGAAARISAALVQPPATEASRWSIAVMEERCV